MLNSSRNILFPLLLCILFTSGCTAARFGNGSFVGDLPNDGATNSIAADTTGYLASLYAPGHTSFVLKTPDEKRMDAFSTVFDSQLRAKGFTILTSPKQGSISLAYVLDKIRGDKGEPLTWYIRMLVQDDEGTKVFARSYYESGQSMAGLSSINFAEKPSLGDKIEEIGSKGYQKAKEVIYD